MRLKLVAVAIAALAPVVAMLGYNEIATRVQRSHEVRAQAAQAARQASSEVERIVEGLRSLLIAVTSIPSVRHLDAVACDDALASLSAKVSNIGAIFVVRADGSPVCGSVPIPADASFADRDYVRKALADKQFSAGHYRRSRVSDSAVIPFAMPVIDGVDVTAIVVSGIRADWLQARIAERGVPRGNAVTIADAAGMIVARVPYPEKFVGTVIPDEFQPLIHASQPGTIEVTSQDGTERVLGYRPIAPPSSPLYVSAGFSKDEAFSAIDRATMINLLGIVAGGLVSMVLAVFIGHRFILVPITEIAVVMTRWKAGSVDARTGMRPTDELHAVGAALDNLLDELDRRRVLNEKAEEERTLLVRELAHRVKNGFALVQAIARQTFARADPDRYGSFSERLTALASTYDLILSKEGSASHIRQVIEAALLAHSSDQERVSISGPNLILSPDLALPLSLILHELATNATKYGSLSVEAGKVNISWSEKVGRIDLTWQEIGGPAVVEPTRKGFGSVLIERAFPSGAKAQTASNFRTDGLRFELSFQVAEQEVDLGVIGGRYDEGGYA